MSGIRMAGTSVVIAFALLLMEGTVAHAQTADKLGWMAGCWEIRTPTRLVEEYWMRPSGGMMMGMSRELAKNELREYESLAIRIVGGKLVYDASPSGQKQTFFPVVYATGDSVMFELPEHDFPQRIGYIRRGADSLVAWIEGTANGRTRKIPYPYTRAACPK